MKILKSKVCVCGAGPAGFIAAIAAARTGADTVILEKNGFPGGMATAGLVGPISKFNFRERRVIGGIPAEFIERLHSAGGAIIDLPSGNIPFDSEIYKIIAMEMLLEAGVKIIFHATVCDTEYGSNNKLNRVIASSEGNWIDIESDYFIDCTGTGSLIVGNPELWRKRNSANSNQPLSLIFKLGGVETRNMTVLMANDGIKYANSKLQAELMKTLKQKLLSNFGGPWTVWGSVIRDGQISVNCTRYSGDVTEPFEFSKAEIIMRREIMPIIEVFRRSDPAFAHCFLQESATTAGYRESREIIGDYRMTGNDIFSKHKFSDTIAFGAHPIDRHLPGHSRQKVEFLTRAYPIPYRSLVSTTCLNLLVAGALAAADPQAFATMRVQAQCMAMGHAAGTAAALCSTRQIPVSKLQSDKLRNTLTAQKAII